MKKSKAKRKLIMSAMALGLAVASTAGSTYAWFSMNQTVSATGMNVEVTTPSNLLIAQTNAEASFSSSLDFASSAQLLQPASTSNGLNYFYVSNINTIKGDGTYDAESTFVAYDSANTSAFNTAYASTGAVAYKDFTLYLKATNTAESAVNIELSKLNLLYNDAAISNDTLKPFRLAFFVEEVAQGASASALASGNYKGIVASVANPCAGISATTPATSAVTSFNGIVAEVPTNTSAAYYAVTIRMWLEGQDAYCTNDTYANLTSRYSLDLEFILDTDADNTPVTVISSVVA